MIWLIFPLGNPLGIWGFYNREDVFLVGGLEHEFSDFPYIGFISLTDELILFRGVGQPPTNYSIL